MDLDIVVLENKSTIINDLVRNNKHKTYYKV